MDRRNFVRAAVLGGAAAGATSYTLGWTPLRTGHADGGDRVVRSVPYVGAREVAGPALRALPLLPLAADPEGRLTGRIVRTAEGQTNLDWYRYCGHEGAPGLDPAASRDGVLRYFDTPDRLAQGANPWYADRLGEPLRPGDFPEPGFGAVTSWRSEGAEGADVLRFVVIRTGTDPLDVAGTGAPLRTGNLTPEWAAFVHQQVEEVGFLAFCAACTHFCCTSYWRDEGTERIARSREAWDTIFCNCHFAAFDPAQVVQDTFVPGAEHTTLLNGPEPVDAAGGTAPT